jgi:5-hydroxyisourate hydrolase-like protein (transthyretin family)
MRYQSEIENCLKLAFRVTNADGRCLDLLPSDQHIAEGVRLEAGSLYKIVFETKDYFDKAGKTTFYPWVEVCARRNISCSERMT